VTTNVEIIMLPLPEATPPPPILKHLTCLANRETERAKHEKRNNYSISLYQRGVVIREGRERELNGRRLTPAGGGTPVCHTIPLGIVIFLVCDNNRREFYSPAKEETGVFVKREVIAIFVQRLLSLRIVKI